MKSSTQNVSFPIPSGSSALNATQALSLKEAIASIRKQHGTMSVMMLGSREALDVDVIPTGSLALDKALGVGGIPRGRIVEIYGPESGGKTTLALHIMAEAQRLGGQVAFVDAEHSLDKLYAQAIGVDADSVVFSQPDNGEMALEIVDTLVSSGAVALVVVDSVAALVPKAELEGQMGDPQMGLQARLMSQAMRKLTAKALKSKTTIVFINQIRDKIGVMFGSPETTTGGRALKFYASIRLDIRKIEVIKEGDTAIGNRVRIKVVKNKVAAPMRQAELTLRFNEGFSKEIELLTFGVECGIVEKSGAWYMWNGGKWQGLEAARYYLKMAPADGAKLEQQIRDKLFPKKGDR